MDELLRRHQAGKMSCLMAGEGQPFLLLHGIPGSAFAWGGAGKLLAEQYQIIIPDLLGFGQSHLALDDDYYMESQAAGLRTVLDALNIKRFYLGGHDFGGPVAITLLRLFPDLVVKGLVLSATNMFTDTYIPPPLRVAGVPQLNKLVFKAIAGNRIGLRLMYLAATQEKQEASWEKFKRHLTPSGMNFTWRIFQRSLVDLKTNYQAIEAMLPQLNLPTLILWGDKDPFFAVSVAQRTQQTIPGSTLKIYENTGHFVPEERPAAVAQDIKNFFENQEREKPYVS